MTKHIKIVENEELKELVQKCHANNDFTPLSNVMPTKGCNIRGIFYRTSITDLTPLKDWDVKGCNLSGIFYKTRIPYDFTDLGNNNRKGHVFNGYISLGCFSGTISEALVKVKEKYGVDSHYYRELEKLRKLS